MTRAPTNIGASVRARLLKLAKERREDFQLLLSRYANERLLHRLSVSAHASQFILKGATLFTLWTGRPHRATRDLDLLGFGDPGQARLRAVFEDILRTDVGDDDVAFDVASLEVGPIREGQEYSGVRLLLRATIVSSVVRLQVDVGFGDAITPGPENSTRIHYARFLAEGLPIATGVIEGACRYLIQDRLGITGARWGLADAEAVLKLRAIRTSGDWDDYWRFHLQNEHARNHPLARAA